MLNIVIIGSGNMAHYLCKNLHEKVNIAAIIGRNTTTSSFLANKYQSVSYSDISAIPDHIDAIIIAVNDDAIAEIVKLLPSGNFDVIHTSGIYNDDKLNCIWPIASINPKTIETLIDANIVVTLAENNQVTEAIARLISKNIYKLNIEQKNSAHLLATIGNNFTNHIMTICFDLSQQMNVPIEMMYPLYRQVTLNLDNNISPSILQTGAARRDDVQTMHQHLTLLENQELKTFYEMMSNLINSYHNKKKGA